MPINFTGQKKFWVVDYPEKTHQNSKFSVCSNGIILAHCLHADSGSKSLSSFAPPPGHRRSYTHPLPSQASSRAASPLLPFTLSIPRAKAAGTGASPAEPARATSPPIVMRVGSPLDLWVLHIIIISIDHIDYERYIVYMIYVISMMTLCGEREE